MKAKRFEEAMQEICASTKDVFWLLDFIPIRALSFHGSAQQSRGVSGWWGGEDRGQAAGTDRPFLKKTGKDQSLFMQPSTP